VKAGSLRLTSVMNATAGPSASLSPSTAGPVSPVHLSLNCLKRFEFLITQHARVKLFLLLRPAAGRVRLRQHLAERSQTLAQFAQRDNRSSVVAIGFGPGEQFPSFALSSLHFIEQGFAEALFVLGPGLANRIGNVILVTE
jgi:hypothetical protein